jgi:imidazolonepropionase
MGLTPEEAFNAVTINGAAAMKISADYGSITRGKYASLIIYNNWAKTVAYIPYAYTEPTIKHVILKGSLYE